MDKTFEITFSYWKQKKIGYFDVLPDIEKTCSFTMQSKIVKAATKQQAEERLQSVFTEKLNIIKIKELEEKEVCFGK